MVTENEQVVEEKVEAEETPATETPPVEEPVASEADLAKEAVKLTEDEPKVDPKDAVIGGFRRDLRKAELRAARAEGALAAKTVAPLEKSPIELAAEAESAERGVSVSVDDVVIDGRLYQAQQAFEKRQAGNQVVQQQTQDYQAGSEAAMLTMSDDVLGEGLGLESLAKAGEHLLTDQDHQEIFLAGKKCGTVFYSKLKKRIIEAGEPDTEGLRKRLNPPKSQAKPPIKSKEKDKPEPPSQEEVLSDSDAQIEAQFDL